jgi:DHA3 family macrolide efflux protein-like MFS transporter
VPGRTDTVGRVGLLRSGRFALLFIGTALNAIGNWATLIALWGYAAFRFHAGPADLGVLGLAWALPGAVLSPVAGVPIDRIGPRPVLLGAFALGAATSVAMAFSGTFAALSALAAVHGLVQAFARPAADTLPPRIVGDADLLAANALLGASEQSSILFGPLVAAAAIAVWGLRGAFLTDAVTFAIGALAIAPLRLHPVDRPLRQHSLASEALEGLRVAKAEPVVAFTLALAGVVFLTWGSFFVIEPLYVRDVLHRSPTVLGLLQSAFGVGLVGTGLLLPKLGDRVATPRTVALSVLLSGLAAALYVGTRSEAVAFTGVFLWGVDVAFFSAPVRTVLQRATPTHVHGRVLALISTLDGWGNAAALPLTALLIAVVGVRAAGVTAGALALVIGAVGLVWAGRFGPTGPGPEPAEETRSQPGVGRLLTSA